MTDWSFFLGIKTTVGKYGKTGSRPVSTFPDIQIYKTVFRNQGISVFF